MSTPATSQAWNMVNPKGIHTAWPSTNTTSASSGLGGSTRRAPPRGVPWRRQLRAGQRHHRASFRRSHDGGRGDPAAGRSHGGAARRQAQEGPPGAAGTPDPDWGRRIRWIWHLASQSSPSAKVRVEERMEVEVEEGRTGKEALLSPLPWPPPPPRRGAVATAA
jgi:hypothetical protein